MSWFTVLVSTSSDIGRDVGDRFEAALLSCWNTRERHPCQFIVTAVIGSGRRRARIAA